MSHKIRSIEKEGSLEVFVEESYQTTKLEGEYRAERASEGDEEELISPLTAPNIDHKTNVSSQ